MGLLGKLLNLGEKAISDGLPEYNDRAVEGERIAKAMTDRARDNLHRNITALQQNDDQPQ